MEEELKNLKYTLEKYNEVIEDSNLKLKNLRELYKNNYEAMLEEKFKLENSIKSIEKARKTPYFARIDFKSNEHFDKCYIGKRGVIDYDNNIITVDWRAPISSLYYDSNVGLCEYQAPDGVIKGELLLKRQYTIENSKLINFNDVDTVSNDELLKPYLNVNADNRLKNIVSTIQSEQNKIIREDLNKNIVIQGVAGSGKTTVALHRIAYLAYNNKELYKPSDYMVIGPNKFFVTYISNILPDLDVNGVCQNTLEELFENYINEHYKINNCLGIIKEEDKTSKYKVSMKMQRKISQYFDNLIILPSKDFVVENIKILNEKFIKNTYDDINKTIFKSIKSQMERLILILNKYINDNIEEISKRFINNKIEQKKIDNFKQNINSYLKKYFNILNKNPKDIYIEILAELNFDSKNIKNNIINIEDITPLMYIKHKLSGSSELINYKHIVVDEAQDYGEFTFYTLNEIFENATFSIFGDLAQGLYPYRSLTNWEEISSFYKNFEILKLNKSYRTTIEIMEEANKINEILNLTKAVPVIRHGERVEYYSENINKLLEKIKIKYKTIAIITKNMEDSINLYNELNSKEINLITSDNLNYDYKITILPSYLSKGLEFDAVILLHESKYNKNNILDMKLLYVSMTRALHKLYIIK